MSGQLSRRTAIAAGGGVVGAALIVACGSGSDGDSGSGGNGGGDASSEPSKGDDSAKSGGAATGKPLAKLSDVPVGGSVRVDSGGDPILLSQPKKGTIMAFSAICTHQGCTVGADGAKLACPCHGSVYDAANGKVLDGPAPRALKAIPVKIDGSDIVASG